MAPAMSASCRGRRRSSSRDGAVIPAMIATARCQPSVAEGGLPGRELDALVVAAVGAEPGDRLQRHAHLTAEVANALHGGLDVLDAEVRARARAVVLGEQPAGRPHVDDMVVRRLPVLLLLLPADDRCRAPPRLSSA